MSSAVVLLAVGSVAFASASDDPTAAGNLGAAQADAARSLSLFRLPSDAVALTSEPVGDQGVLGAPGVDVGTPNLVDAHAWWSVPGTSAGVLAYVEAHPPAGAKLSGTGGGNAAPGLEGATFTLPAIAGVLSERILAVTVVQLDAGTTGVRTDGEAVWIVPRPAWEEIPAYVVGASFTGSGWNASGEVGPVSAPRRLAASGARRLASFINGLEIVQPGAEFCPLGPSGSVGLSFYGPGGGAVAQAAEELSGCGFVSLRIAGRTGPALEDYPSVTEELELIGAIPVCAASQVQAAKPSALNPDEQFIWFTFTNRSDSVCRLSGFPRVALFGARGRALRTQLTDAGAAAVKREGLDAAVALDPEQSASFVASFSTCRAPAAAQARITLPGISQTFAVSVGSLPRPFEPCHGQLRIGNLNWFM